MIVKRLIFFGRSATHACDGKCNKAWGRNSRRKIQLSEDPDDFAYLADDELGDAPEDPGIYEGGDAKPVGAEGPDDVNRWCVRECERAWMSPPSRPDATPELPDFSVRFYNVSPHRRTPGAETPASSPIDDFAVSLSEEQARRLTSKLDASQDQELMGIVRASSKKDGAP